MFVRARAWDTLVEIESYLRFGEQEGAGGGGEGRHM